MDPFARWLEALEARHLAELRPAEIARGVRALSSLYVERRQRLARGAVLAGRAKRAAFALFYAPLHFLAVRLVVRALAAAPPVRTVVDLGCGTGAAGAAWALELAPRPRLLGIDRHPWAVAETRWTYRTLNLRGRSVCVRLENARWPDRDAGLVAAFTL
ncbi:MAG TPA: methyltransferase, partial [Vicinamibacterales bacterium]|nr:methyltransferase [Vicinamibacterales bacterium]